ncbi:MAG: glycerate kinase [Gallionella sp.]|nr:glycerate kinase [Gallionella sp.]
MPVEWIFKAALAAVDPCHAVRQALRVERGVLQAAGGVYDLAAFDRILVVGAGKAGAGMAQGVESLLVGKMMEGLIIVKQGCSVPLSFIEQVEAAHPVPDAAGVAGTRRILQMLQTADARTLVICLLSGGASALLVAPVSGITLQDKQQVTRLLLESGAGICELNAVRKHLSGVKGGRLAEAAYPAPLLALIISDVIGDALDVIASGPAAADNSSFVDAWAVIVKYGLRDKLPRRVVDYLQQGLAGRAPETVKNGDTSLSRTRNVIVASNRQALAAAKAGAEQLGFSAAIITDALQGEARAAARWLADRVRAELADMQPGDQRCLISGGETTVWVRGKGKGGRNQELALAFALAIEGCQGVRLLSAGTDGGDGQTDAAGAKVNGETVARARGVGMESRCYLDENDSYTFFRQFDAALGAHSHFKTGPTGTNVMDIQIVLLHKPA